MRSAPVRATHTSEVPYLAVSRLPLIHFDHFLRCVSPSRENTGESQRQGERASIKLPMKRTKGLKSDLNSKIFGDSGLQGRIETLEGLLNWFLAILN